MNLIKIMATYFIVGSLMFGTVYAATRVWECNTCKQQYIGDNPPRFAKCPATNNTRNHWWIIR